MKRFEDTYKDIVLETLLEGTITNNRNNVRALKTECIHYKINLKNNYLPLLTTKDMSGYVLNSFKEEFLWYISGDHHINNLNSKIWDLWADEKGNLETAYGYYWRQFPSPKEHISQKGTILEGIATADKALSKGWVEDRGNYYAVDQLKYLIDTLRENPESKRMVVSAWEPGNAIISKLPPCHDMWFASKLENKVNVHLTQRAGDVGLGIPFNAAAYSLITHLIAIQTKLIGAVQKLDAGTFSHTIVDPHIYIGFGERAKFYQHNYTDIQKDIASCVWASDYKILANELENILPKEEINHIGEDHIPHLLKQLSSTTHPDKPEVHLPKKHFDNLKKTDLSIRYASNEKRLKMKPAV